MTRPSPFRPTTLAAAALMVAALFAAIPAAQAGPFIATPTCLTNPCDIGDAAIGPLTHIDIGTDLSCQVLEGTTPEYTDCGTFVAVNGTLYGPPISTSPGATTAYDEKGQTVTGDGSLQDPNQVTTQVNIGKLDVTEVDTYAAGQSSYKTRITLHNEGATAITNVRLYRAADCALGDDTTGLGAVETTTVAPGHPAQLVSISCTDGTAVESWVPNSVNATYMEGPPAALWNTLQARAAFLNACACPGSPADNAAGLSWTIPSIGANASVVRGDQTNLAADGATPLTEVVKADNVGESTAVDSNTLNGYTITIHNPSTSSAQITSITDYLIPTALQRFSYVAGSTTGDFGTDDPLSGPVGTLTWSNGATIPARTDLHLHFKVQAPAAGGARYANAASAVAAGRDVAPTGPSAIIHVTQAFELTLHKGGTGTGTVTSSPAGISCGPICTGAAKAYDSVPTVKLTAAKSLGSVFTGWSGACTGTASTCTVVMSQDRDITAGFDRVCTSVAYASGGDIWTVPATGGTPTALVSGTAGTNYQPAWSPNCAKLAFTSTRSGTAQVYVVPAGGGSATVITKSPLLPSSQPSWSADGSHVAFTRAWKGKSQIYVVPASGGGGTRITDGSSVDTQPDWSPVGPRIVFTSTAGGRDQLYSILSTGKGLTRLTSSVGANSQAAWSPTGARLLFVSTRDGNPEIYVMNANGSSQIRLTRSKTFAESHPAWSPTGASFAFASNRFGNPDVFTRTLAGADLADLTTTDSGADSSPAWSS